MPVTICDVSPLMTGIKAAVSWSRSRVTITLWLDSLSLLSANSHSLPCAFPPAADMAELLQKMCRCLSCPAYLEQPLSLECGCSFCPDCVRSLPQEPHGEGLVCSFCSKVSRKNHLRPNRHLGQLVSKVKELEPQLRAILQMNPRMRRFRGKDLPTLPPSLPCAPGAPLHPRRSRCLPPRLGSRASAVLSPRTAENHLVTSDKKYRRLWRGLDRVSQNPRCSRNLGT